MQTERLMQTDLNARKIANVALFSKPLRHCTLCFQPLEDKSYHVDVSCLQASDPLFWSSKAAFAGCHYKRAQLSVSAAESIRLDNPWYPLSQPVAIEHQPTATQFAPVTGPIAAYCSHEIRWIARCKAPWEDANMCACVYSRCCEIIESGWRFQSLNLLRWCSKKARNLELQWNVTRMTDLLSTFW